MSPLASREDNAFPAALSTKLSRDRTHIPKAYTHCRTIGVTEPFQPVR